MLQSLSPHLDFQYFRHKNFSQDANCCLVLSQVFHVRQLFYELAITFLLYIRLLSVHH